MIRLAFDPTFPARDYSKRQVTFGDGQKGRSSPPTGYRAAVARRLFVVTDELLFVQRLLAAARRLGTTAEPISPSDARTRAWDPDDVVVLQATLRPEAQLGLVDQLTQRRPAPVVIAVTGHLETELRRKLKARGAILAPHSGMDRVLARALGVSVPDDAARHPRT